MSSATMMMEPTLSWSQVMYAERFIAIESGLKSAEKVLDVLVVAAGHLFGGAEELDSIFGEQGHLGRHARHRPNVVRHHDTRHFEFPLELHDQLRDRRRRQRVEA